MDSRLRRLIEDYNRAVAEAVEALVSAGLPTPESDLEWGYTILDPQVGVLKGGARYFKHGFGIMVQLPGRPTVDFDFGSEGEIDGISPGFLYDYMSKADIDYGIESSEVLDELIDEALASGDIVKGETLLYIRQGRTEAE